ncbi:MAG: hypothetical protein P8163_15680 [Candidatus Thiodiazotropha sp.]
MKWIFNWLASLFFSSKLLISRISTIRKFDLLSIRLHKSAALRKTLLIGVILWMPLTSSADDRTAAWGRQLDPVKNEVTFRPNQSDPEVDILVKYYPAKPLGGKGADDWLRDRLFNSKAPRGIWKGAGKVVRDNAILSHGQRSFTKPDGTTGVIIATAVSLDQQSVRLSILVFSQNEKNLAYLEKAQALLVDFVDDEKQRLRSPGGKLNIESSDTGKKSSPPTQKKTKQYEYSTPPGEGLTADQIEAFVYTFDFHYAYGGMRMDEYAFLLTKDGRVMKEVPVAPEILDVEKSRLNDPDRWGWWQYDGEDYRFAWSDNRQKYSLPRGRQMIGKPIPPGTRLEGIWSDSSSYSSLGYSSSSFWGVTLDKQGRFRKYRNSMMQAGGMSGGGGPLVTSTSNNEGSALSVIGNSVGGGSSRKNSSPEAKRSGSYYFDGYNLTLSFDSGLVKRVATFTTGENYHSIWFDGGDLSRKKDD